MKILVTGENGYISNELAKYIKTSDPSINIIKKSVRLESIDEVDLHGIDTVVHAAAIVHKKETTLSPDIYHKVNVQLTEKLALRAKSAGVKHFIFFSTMAVYGDTVEEITSNIQLQPKSLYGKTKLEAESILQNLEDKHFIVSIVRPPMVYGPNCPGNYIMLSKLSKTTFIFPEIENKRSMIFIYNLTEFIYQLLQNKTSGIFHPQDREYVKTSLMVKEIASAYNKKIMFSKFTGKLLKVLIGNKGIFKKVFGDLYYSQELSTYKDNSYQKYDLKKSILLTEKK